jgi:hypothetical protein
MVLVMYQVERFCFEGRGASDDAMKSAATAGLRD